MNKVLFILQKRIIGPFQGGISSLFHFISDTYRGPTPLPLFMLDKLLFQCGLTPCCAAAIAVRTSNLLGLLTMNWSLS